MSDALARVIATALEAARAVDEERIRQLIREELQAFRPAQASGWMTPPAAAKALGIGVKRVRAMIDSGAVVTRARNLEPGKARQIKREVSLESLERALSGKPETSKAIEAALWAAARTSRRSA